jgi:glycosyltransferase involved in cell wall biosynthesis
MKIVSISSMFPNPAQPISGIFVQNRLSALAKLADLRVISPIPYFPLIERVIPRYKERSGIPKALLDGAYPIYYPRFLSIPMFFKPLDGVFLFFSLLPMLVKLRRSGFDFDLIDAHLAFPEGYACRFLGWLLKKKVCVTLRGHDINDIPAFPVRKRQVIFSLRNADRVYAVSAALKTGAIELGADAGRIMVSSNGVDIRNFIPGDRVAARRKLGLPEDGKLILSIGYLVPRKGFHHLIAALDVLVNKRGRKDIRLCIVGGRGGEEYSKPHLDSLIAAAGLGDHVIFAGQKPNRELPDWYNACDVFALMSSKEGWPNVILEAMACGVPVVANAVWGIPEIVCSEAYGYLVQDPPQPDRTAEALAKALGNAWDREAIIAYARSQTWDKVAERLLADMRSI